MKRIERARYWFRCVRKQCKSGCCTDKLVTQANTRNFASTALEIMAEHKGKTLYKMVHGPYDSLEEAQNAKISTKKKKART